MVAVAHARGVVEQDHQLTVAAGRREGRRAAREERPRERRDDQRDRRGAHQQQEPVPDPPPADRLIGDLLDEHQRRELDDALPLALNQMHENRHRDGAETEEEERGEEGHQDP